MDRAPPPTVTHNTSAHRFEAQVDGLLCRCDYLLQGTVMRLVHTEVPPPLQNRGIAAALVSAAFAHARSAHLSVVPACSYVRAYVARHPETHDLLAR
jgi:predicted GNAT family acetyltransferase